MDGSDGWTAATCFSEQRRVTDTRFEKKAAAMSAAGQTRRTAFAYFVVERGRMGGTIVINQH